MENVICTVVQEKTVQGFISVLNKYGVCTDYSNDYERSKAIKGIFVGVINKVYDVVWKGEGGHVEHDTLFMSAKCLISNKRESQPFRVGFVGSIVSQLVEINLKEGDAIAILKPKFFYALDVPTLCAGVGNVVAWVAKGLKDIESSEDLTKSSDENHCFESKNKRQSKATNNNRKRIPFIDEDSDSQTIGESSTSGTLQHDIQIYRSRPVELRPSSVPANNKLVPDSTTRSVLQRCQNNPSTENKSTPENLFAENIVSQNTANVGSTDVCCRNENHSNTICNLESAAKSVHKGLCSSFRNATNNTCGVHSHPTSCKTKCCSSRINCCNHAISANYLKENCCSCNNITPCACFNNRICSCARSICCGHNTLPQCMRWNSARSCHTNYSSCYRNVDHQCRSMKSCCGPCHTQIRQCCSTSHCQNSCIKSNHCHRQTNLEKTSISCCHKQITTPVHCHNNSLCCSNHEKINTCENGRAPHCCASKPESNSQQNKQDDFNEEISVELSEDFLKKKRTNEWVHNLVGNLPELLKDIAASEPLETSSQSSSPDSRNNVMEASKSCSDQRHLLSSDQLLSCNPSEPISKNKPQNRILKKKKLFSPLDNSTIISARSVYCNSTIIEESTPFDSENQTDTPQEGGLSSDKNQKPKEKEANLPENINQDNPDSITTNDVNNVGERLCSEKNAQEPPIISQHQNKGALNVENRNSSEEQFPELRIETPIISETNDMNQRVSDVADLVEISSLMDNSDPNQHSEESTPAEKIGNDKESSFVKVCDGKNAQCQSSNVQDLAAGKNDQCQSSNVQALATVNTNSKESSCNKSLALQDHSKAKVLSDDEGIDEWDMDVAPTSDKEGTKRSKESSDDTMELTSEATLMKRRKKEKYRKTRSVGSLCFGRNGDASPSNASSFHDAHSDGILSSFNSNRWCSKPVKEPSAPMSQEQKEKILAHCSAAYKLNLFSVITVRGAIINILPSLSEENYGNIVRGFCNEGCRKEYSYEEYNLMSQVCVDCNFCKYNFHLACPGCKEEGLRRPLCCYYKFEIHLYDGENVLRVEIDHRNGITFLGCTPQLYLVSKSVYNRLSRIIYSVTEDKEKDPILLKAKIKVMPKTGASVLTLHNTTLRHQLTFKGNYYRF